MEKLLVLLMAYLFAGNVYADGCFVPSNKDINLSEPEQKAILVWDGKKETIILSSKVKADKVEDLMKIAWLVPVPSSVKPEVNAADMEAFGFIAAYFPVLHDKNSINAERGLIYARGVQVIEAKKVDIYDITVLKATSAQELVDWLNKNGYPVPQNLTALVDYYIQKYHGCYFIANKIDITGKVDIRAISSGFATPIRIDFYPPEPIYPLKISSGNLGKTRIDVYCCGQDVFADSNNILRFNDYKPAAYYLKRNLKPYLDMARVKFITRLVYEGDLAGLTKDAILETTKGISDIGSAGDEKTFENIFAQYSTQDNFENKLAAFVEKYPRSRFADDAVLYLSLPLHNATDVYFGDSRTYVPAVSAARLKVLVEAVKNNPWHIEDFSRREHFVSESSLWTESYDAKRASNHSREEDALTAGFKEKIIQGLAMRYKHDGKNAQADQLIKTAPELAWPRYADSLGCCDILRNASRDAQGAFDKHDFKGAVTVLEKAFSDKEVDSCNIMELAHDYWLSGNAYFYLEKYKEACRYYQKALFLIIKDEDSGKQHAFTQLLLAGVYNNGYTLGGPTYVGISRLLLFNNLITAYLRAGDIDAGMEYSLKFLSLFKEIEDKGHINRPDVISGAYYSIACAYALKKDKVDALKYVEKSIAIDSSKKKEIRGDTDLKIIWDDEKFKSLTAE